MLRRPIIVPALTEPNMLSQHGQMKGIYYAEVFCGLVSSSGCIPTLRHLNPDQKKAVTEDELLFW